MDPTKLTAATSGEMRRYYSMHLGRDDWAFVPAELPPEWSFPTELWPLLAEAKEALGTLNGIGQTLPNPDLLLRPLQSREAITSSRIEGTYVTPQELLLFELEPIEPTSSAGQAADWKEVWNYSRALRLGSALLTELPIASRWILEVHRTLMAGVRGQDKTPGEYRRIQVQIGHAGRYVPPPPGEVQRLMGNFDSFVNSPNEQYDPLVVCYLAHYQFEAIHPFIDGNGRVGRALLALMVHQRLGHTMPWLYMSAFYEKNKEEYTELLLRVSTHGDWARWIEFCLFGTVAQAKDAITRCGKFNEARVRFHDMVKSPTPRSHDIIESLFTSPVLTIPSVVERYQIVYHTARKDLEKLVEDGILREAPNNHPRTFVATELMRIAYNESPWDDISETVD